MMCISQFIPDYDEPAGFPENKMLHDLVWAIYAIFLIPDNDDCELPI